jgi:hypothetical protein
MHHGFVGFYSWLDHLHLIHQDSGSSTDISLAISGICVFQLLLVFELTTEFSEYMCFFWARIF